MKKCVLLIIVLITISLLNIFPVQAQENNDFQDSYSQDKSDYLDQPENLDQNILDQNQTSQTDTPEVKQGFYTATVVNVEQKTDPSTGQEGKVKTVTLEITSGDKKGQEAKSSWVPVSAEEEEIFSLNQGDKVIVQYTKMNEMESWSIMDKQRAGVLWWLLIILAVVLIVISRWYGIKSLATLFITALVILYFLVPQIAKGADPLIITILAAGFFIIPSLLLSHGFNKKTYIAIVGIVFSVIIVAILAKLVISWAQLTGINTEETFYINLGEQKINLLNLLLAGIILGTVGVMDDIAITQSSVVLELRKINKNLAWQEVFKKAMQVGNDHIASVINTLFLAYVGASLPLVLLLTQQEIPFMIAIQREFVATEIIRILVGTIGLVLTVPLTTVIAALIFTRKLSWAKKIS